ncbi:hypothetical protein NLJ89_g9893 [Agrocybe chaxingu]|uniref:Transmembrane protein n=1 Tax=Agrocybe chaxingu TaxID=84603 RepID=A0A9W8MT44_9AGAR|nr:hypothetical protein NLJ89_g9893 [Agrocybe chaxingu]
MCTESRTGDFLLCCVYIWILVVVPFLTPPVATFGLSLVGTGVLAAAGRPHLSTTSIALSSIFGGLLFSSTILILYIILLVRYARLTQRISPTGPPVPMIALNILVISTPSISIGASFLLGLQNTRHSIVKEELSSRSVLVALEAALIGCGVFVCAVIITHLVSCLFIPVQAVPKFLFSNFIGRKEQLEGVSPEAFRDAGGCSRPTNAQCRDDWCEGEGRLRREFTSLAFEDTCLVR